MTMSNQAENEQQQTLTPEAVRQVLLDASQQAITELNDEELKEIAGGMGWGREPFLKPTPTFPYPRDKAPHEDSIPNVDHRGDPILRDPRLKDRLKTIYMPINKK